MKVKNWLLGAASAAILVGALFGIACKSSKSTWNANATKTAQGAHGTTTPHAMTGTPPAKTTPSATVPSTSMSSAADPCTLRTSLEGLPLTPGPSFALDASTKWQLCVGGAAAGSGEKFLFKTTNGGAAWTLISRTTLGNPPQEAGVGQLPNGNGVTQILFLDATHGWMGLNSPGVNLFRSQDGGVSWTEVSAIPPRCPSRRSTSRMRCTVRSSLLRGHGRPQTAERRGPTN